MFIPTKWVPYLLIILGIFGIVVMSIYGGADTGDTIFGIVVCFLCVVSGVIWLVINMKQKTIPKKSVEGCIMNDNLNNNLNNNLNDNCLFVCNGMIIQKGLKRLAKSGILSV